MPHPKADAVAARVEEQFESTVSLLSDYLSYPPIS